MNPRTSRTAIAAVAAMVAVASAPLVLNGSMLPPAGAGNLARLMSATATTLGRLAAPPMRAAATLFQDGGAGSPSTFCAPTGAETLETDKAHYVQGDTVQVTGAGYAAACEITASITQPDGTSSGSNGMTDAEGRVSFSYPVGSQQGDYRVDVMLGDSDPWTSAAFTGGGYIEPDMLDYAPGNRVTIKGGGWLPGELVKLVIEELDGPDSPATYFATADSAGDISNGDFITDLNDLGVHFRITATGASSGFSFEAEFSDGFTATSRATGNWNADATWSITRPGLLTCPGGASKICTGNGAGGQNFINDLAIGNMITLTADGTVIGTIASVDSASQITLVAVPTARTNVTFKARRAPAADDDAVIGASTDVTVTVPASINSLNITSTAGTSVVVNASQSLTVTGAATVTGNGATNLIAVNGTLNAGSLSITGGGNGSSIGRVNVASTGSVVAGAITVNQNSGNAELNAGAGSVSAGSLDQTAGSNSGSPQSIVSVGSGSVTVSGNYSSSACANTGNGDFHSNCFIVFTAPSGIIHVGGNLGDDFSMTNFTTGGGSTIDFNGPNAGSIPATPNSFFKFQNLSVNKSGVAVAALAGSVTINGGLAVNSGTFAGAGSLTLTLGGNVSNSGTISLDGGTVGCGGADTVLLRSTAPGTARSWSGGGTFNITDVSVQDQNGPITATSSVLVSNSNWTINPGCVTVTTTGVSSSANPSTYGSPVIFTATISPSGATGSVQFVVDGSPSGSPVTVSGGGASTPSTSSLTAGNHTVVANFTGTGTFGSSSGTLSPVQKVNAALVTATAGSGSGTYNGSTQSPSACVVSGAYIGGLSCANSPTSVGPGVGTTVIAPITSGADLANFTVTPVNGSYKIDPALVTATAGSGSGTYNGSTQSPSACVVSGAYIGSLSCANSPSAVGPGIGTTVIAPITSGADLANFTVTPVNGSYTIDPALVTATAGGGSGTYNGSTQSPSACVVSGAYIGSLSCANSPSAVGPGIGTTVIAPITSGADLANFTVTPVNGSYTIDPALVTATAGGGSGTYNGSTQSPSECVVSGAYIGGLSCANSPSAVGPGIGTTAIAPITSGADLANFTVTPVNGSYKIDPALVTATAGGGSGTYNGSTQSPSECVVSGAYIGGLSCANSPSAVGPGIGTTAIAPITSGADLANFTVTPVNGSYTIDPALVTATAGGGSGTYNGSTQSPSECVVSGAYIGGLSCANSPSAVGPGIGTTVIAPITSGADVANFTVTPVNGSYTIDPAPVTATAGSGSGTYTGFTQSPSECVVSGAYIGGLSCANNPSAVGPDVVTAAIAPITGGAGLANFTVTPVNGSYTISQATPSVTVTGGTFLYDTFSHAASCSATGIGGAGVTGSCTFTYNGVAASPIAAGTYAVVASFTSSNGNYGPATGTGSLTILPDTDLDTITDANDNCPSVSNTDQLNSDGDSMGNACDPDDDNDEVLDINDACSLVVGEYGGCPGAVLWIGLKNSDDVGTYFDLKVEVKRGAAVVGSGELDKVKGGSSGFNNASPYTIPMNMSSDLAPGDTLKVSVRNTCFGPSHNSGTARLWYDGSDTAAKGANSRYDGPVVNFLRNIGAALKLDVAAGTKTANANLFLDKLVDNKIACGVAGATRPFVEIGSFTK